MDSVGDRDAEVIARTVGLDPRRPWPGVPRDPEVRAAGLTSLVGADWVEERDLVTGAPVEVSCVVLAPSSLATSADPGVDLARLRGIVPVGGHVVSEEPGVGCVAELEPLFVDGERAALASVVRSDDADGSGLDLAVLWFSGDPGDTAEIRVERARVVPLSAAEQDAIASVNGFELVARWSDWAGRPAGDGWRISIHRRVS